MKLKCAVITMATGLVLTSAVALSLSLFQQEGHASTSGAPSAKTGSPGDGNISCTDCHAGTETTLAGLITSNIPSTGYIPGNTYTITGSITDPAKSKFGFEISPQNTAGTKLGTLILTDATRTKLVGSSKYVTHTTAGSSAPSHTATWSFDWTAPASGVGPVTFYGAFLITNSSGSDMGDVTKLSTLTVSESTIGIKEVAKENNVLSIFPNPCSSVFQVKLGQENQAYSLSVFSLNGQEVCSSQGFAIGETVLMDVRHLPAGHYMVRLIQGNQVTSSSLVKLGE